MEHKWLQEPEAHNEVVDQEHDEGYIYRLCAVISESKEAESMVYNFGVTLREEMAMKEKRGFEKGYKKGIEDSINEGENRKAISIIKNALLKGLEISTIAEITELPVEEVEKIKNEMQLLNT